MLSEICVNMFCLLFSSLILFIPFIFCSLSFSIFSILCLKSTFSFASFSFIANTSVQSSLILSIRVVRDSHISSSTLFSILQATCSLSCLSRFLIKLSISFSADCSRELAFFNSACFVASLCSISVKRV